MPNGRQRGTGGMAVEAMSDGHLHRRDGKCSSSAGQQSSGLPSLRLAGFFSATLSKLERQWWKLVGVPACLHEAAGALCMEGEVAYDDLARVQLMVRTFNAELATFSRELQKPSFRRYDSFIPFVTHKLAVVFRLGQKVEL